jgi:uncharacterized membrane protein
MKKTSRVILITVLILAGLAIILCPILFFIKNFNNQIVSPEIEHWGMFGDFFGGVTNTIISFVSLIVLTYISIVISEIGSEEHEKALIRERKREAYDQLYSHLSILTLSPFSIIRQLNSTTSSHSILMVEKKDFSLLNHALGKIESIISEYEKYYTFLFNFSNRYNHLFKTDLLEGCYKQMIDSSKAYVEVLNELYTDILNQVEIKPKKLQNALDIHVEYVTEYLNLVLDEIRSDNQV